MFDSTSSQTLCQIIFQLFYDGYFEGKPPRGGSFQFSVASGEPPALPGGSRLP